jgi:glucose/arabinose dehydrogenase
MRTRPLIAAATAIGIGAATAVIAVTLSPPATAQVAGGYDFTQPEVVASGLNTPWGLAFLPDGSALVGERNSARLLQLRPGQPPQVIGTVPGVQASNEGGLLGLAVSPNYAQDQWVYAYYSTATDNRIVRFRLNAIQNQEVILSGLGRGFIHDGGRIAFGPDGMLYAGVGDAGNTANAQNLQSLNGKILRMTPTGGVPADNPFGNSLVWSLGHRNVQGLAWDAQGRMWASEFGQNTWDELNQIVPGGNYGWPTVEGMANNPQFRNPAAVWTPAEASPSGLAFANDTLFMAALRGQRLWTVPVNANGTVGTPVAELQGQYGRLRTVARGPDGWLWVTTSNRDGRGNPSATDDRVLRFPPASGGPTGTSTGTPPVTETPPPPGCTATYQKVNEWPGGFQASVRVVNTGFTPRTGWTVRFTFPSGQTITQLWDGTYTQTGANVTISNAPWNATLPPNGSATVGFLGTWSTSNADPTSVTCQ